MVKTNYHTHTEFCDGKASAAAMAAAAAQSGYAVLGFSAHAPLPFPTKWNIDAADLGAYRETVRALAAEYAGRMEILLGYEIDWLAGKAGPTAPLWEGVERDFAIGSVHFVKAPDGFLFTVDEGNESFRAGLDGHFGGDGRKLVEEYYRNVRDLVAAGGFQILGHFDLVKKNNGKSPFFDESASWHRDLVFSVVDDLADSGIVAELNVGGMARGKVDEPYPGPAILARMRERGVPITVCSDAHAPAHLDSHWQAGIEAAKAAGYRELSYFSRGQWRTTGI